MVPHQDAHPVGVGVGAQDEVGPLLLGDVHGQIEALGVLRVRGGHRGEVAVQHHLLGHAEYMLHSKAAQGLGDQLIAAAVEGGVHHLEAVGHPGHHRLVVGHGHHVGQELLVRLLPHQGDHAAGGRLVVGHSLGAGEHVQLAHLGGHLLGMLGGQLGAVGPVDLIAVVLLGVVAGGDVDAGDAAILPHGEGQLRRGAQGLEQPHGDAVGGHDAGGLAGELLRVVPAVEADGDAPLGGLGPLLQDHLGEGLGGMADNVDVHPVQAHPHDAPQAGGAEGQLVEKAGLDLFVVIADGLQLRLFIGGQRGGGQPLLISFTVGHNRKPPCISFGVLPL